MEAREDTTTVRFVKRKLFRVPAPVPSPASVPPPPTGPSSVPPTPAPRRPGTVLARRYHLVRPLGAGSAGSVYEAFDTATRTRCAVKVLHARLARSQDHVDRFLREAWIVASIGHPGVVPILDAGTDGDGCCYIVFELLRGESLEHAMARGAVGTSEAIEVVRKILAILDAVHERGVVHRDVKPENVFLSLTPSGTLEVRLLDFGIAKLRAAQALTLQGAQLGTPFYMSPEQWKSEPVGPATDLWSTGALLYHALTDGPPFEADDLGTLRVKVLTERLVSLGAKRPDLPSGVVDAVDRALAKRAAERWPTAALMADALGRSGVSIASLDWDDWSR